MTREKLPERVLLGPGPSDVHERVLRAMARPLIGHLDPEFLGIMDDNQRMLREVFGTENRMTIPISGTGSAGMEAAMVNLVEPGDRVVVCIAGVFGVRLAEQARRNGAEVVTVETEWGTVIDTEAVSEALAGGDTKVLAIVHAETSTGVLQPLYDIVQAAHAAGALVIVDAVTSIGAHPVDVDAREIDVCYAGTQKCLSCPPGLAPITFNDRALEAVAARATPVRSWYLDVSLLNKYWGTDRVYHHTAPISMVYALQEALRIVLEEGEEPRAERHRRNHEAFIAGVEAMGMSMQVEDERYRLWSLNAVRVPDGIDEAAVRKQLLRQYGIEIGGGLGPLAGKIWRVGLMGESSRRNNVLLLLGALEGAIAAQGHDVSAGAGVSAALASYG
ncbi:MAG: alanine--glyoxylate aminotransferase family protein [Acidobacteriota bacterium]|jgi:alanine-glyoxylate transaminase/serine-glyoxylate transaminase/serine-pyruvate transaminase